MLIIIRIIIIINTVAAELNVLIFKYYFVETSTLPTLRREKSFIIIQVKRLFN